MEDIAGMEGLEGLIAETYKARREAFVSNLTGTTVEEVNLVTLVAAAAICLWSALQARQRFFTPYTILALVTDFLLNCCAILLATTQYSSAPALLNTLLFIPALFLYFSEPTPAVRRANAAKKTKASKLDNANPNSRSVSSKPDPLPLKPFVTTYRGNMMVITCTSILAVDFNVFPRRFAKVETWGTSLMDVGVGSFVFSGGLVSARALLKAGMQTKGPLLSRMITALRHSIPLLVLGLVRLYSVKGLDYAEHVSEYGVHWNFFFTLGLLPPFVALLHSFPFFKAGPKSLAVLAVVVAVAYQTVLDSTELEAFILTAPREDLLSKNREGISSFVGYLAIFLAGQATGMYVLPRERLPPSPPSSSATILDKLRRWCCTTLARLILWAGIWSGLFVITTADSGLAMPISRRIANLPYFLWITAFNCCQITLYAVVEAVWFPGIYDHGNRQQSNRGESERERGQEATSRLLHAFNRNGLAIFLIANLLTGLVNLTLPTLDMGQGQAMAVLVVYTAILAGLALGLDAWDMSIKF
ncbi:GPI-anchored wall transfer protein 1 [Lineolata rhizophorae]|uniref:GPI-anchored wall transfer protein n=1 Tax=Lineolata rhizophorae TaxID=578093 RepID=A0A6A6NU02_9PEZI|nr:GPI-anchored wall transfer protein 1 [Lineolata rhizophorae]